MLDKLATGKIPDKTIHNKDTQIWTYIFELLDEMFDLVEVAIVVLRGHFLAGPLLNVLDARIEGRLQDWGAVWQDTHPRC